MADNENRIIELETKISFLEDTVEQLNTVIINQRQILDELNTKFQILHKKMEEEIYSNQMIESNPANEKPPHY